MILAAMKQALEALDLALSDEPYFVKVGIAMVALRQAIEQAEKNDFYPDWNLTKPLLDRISELEAQVCKHQWVSLTDEQIVMLLRRVTIEASNETLYITERGMKTFAKQLEQLLKDANT